MGLTKTVGEELLADTTENHAQNGGEKFLEFQSRKKKFGVIGGEMNIGVKVGQMVE